LINIWNGIISSAWNIIGNWTETTFPTTDANIIFDDAPLNDLLLDNNRSINNITNAQATYNLNTNGFKLTIKGNLNFTNSAKIDATTTNSIIEFAGSSAQSIESGHFASSKVDNLTIDNSVGVTLNTDFAINNSLTINTGKLLTIPTTKSLNVVGSITNNAGVSGLVIQASSLAANGSLIFHNAVGSPVPATVEMYSKAFCLNPAPKTNYQWQYFGIPVRSIIAGSSFYNSWVRKWDEALDAPNNHWVPLSGGSVLTSFTGYEITQDVAKIITFKGNLENKDTTFVMSYTSTASYPGQQIYSNPYLAAIDITKLAFGTQTDATVYLYNTGSFEDWTNSGFGTTMFGSKQGQYMSVPKEIAGQNDLPLEIPSMQGFLVKALSNSPNATLGINYSSVVVKNSDKQRVPTANGISSTEKVSTIIDVKGTHTSDRMWIFSEPNSTRRFDNGWDGRKIIGSAVTPQLFAIEADGNYQVNTVPDMNETKLGFQAGEDLEYTFIFTHQNIEKLYEKVFLLDFQENRIIDVTTNGTQYTFTKSNHASVARFKIVTSPNEKATTDAETPLKIFSANRTIFVQNLSSKTGCLKLFNMSGSFVEEIQFDSNSIASFSGNLIPGAYIVCAVTNTESVNKCVIVK